MTTSDPSSFNLSVIGQVAIPVTDLERSIPFYRDVLGMRFQFQVPPGLAFFDCQGVRLLLDVPASQISTKRSSILYFKVDNIQSAYNTLLSRNVRFDEAPKLVAKMPDHDLWMAFFRDPDDNLLALMCEVR